MKKKLLVIAAFLTLALKLSLTASSSSGYRISEVPCEIDDFIHNDKMYLYITLPVGLEIPDQYTIYKANNGWTCELNTKVVDGALFPDSEGYSLSNFTIIAQAYDEPESNSVIFTIKKITKVLQEGLFTCTTRTTTDITKFSYGNMQLNMANSPELIGSDEKPQDANIIFDILLTD